MIDLKQALQNQLWINHQIGSYYNMEGDDDLWKISYYPIFENGKTNKQYKEPRALIEKPMQGGTDFREVPLRYLTLVK